LEQQNYAGATGRWLAKSKKRGEIVEVLGDLGLDLRDLTSWPDAPEVVEDGATFAEHTSD
jgi:hypothetical protein